MTESELFPLIKRYICWRYLGLNTLTGEKAYLTQWFENRVPVGFGAIKIGRDENLSLREHFPASMAYDTNTYLVHAPGLKCPLDITPIQVRKAGRIAV